MYKPNLARCKKNIPIRKGLFKWCLVFKYWTISIFNYVKEMRKNPDFLYTFRKRITQIAITITYKKFCKTELKKIPSYWSVSSKIYSKIKSHKILKPFPSSVLLSTLLFCFLLGSLALIIRQERKQNMYGMERKKENCHPLQSENPK